MMRSPEGEKRDYIARYLSDVVYLSVPTLPYNELAAEWHGRERARLEKAGLIPGFSDSMIAAVATTSELILVTRNVKEFERFKDLKIENWFEG